MEISPPPLFSGLIQEQIDALKTGDVLSLQFKERKPIVIKRKWLYVAIVLLAVAIGGHLKAENLKQTRVSGIKSETPVVKQETIKPVKKVEVIQKPKVVSQKQVTATTKLNNNVCVIAMKKVFPQHLWVVGEAIMRAESGARPDAIGGPNYNGTYDYGCWQINDTKRALDPDVGTKIAWYKYNHSGWSPWVAWKNGRYRRFL